jgi:ribosomal protein S18 acetylase RimI-like enzyme
VTGAVSVGPIPHDFDRWDELLAVIRASFAYMDGVIDPPSSVHRLTARSLRAKATVELGFLATAGDEIAGSAFLSEKDDHCYLGKLAVAPAWQGRGIGRLLLQAVEEHARRAGKPVIELGTRVELIANQRLFARLGFVEIERVAHEGFDRPTSVTMRKALA